ESTPHKIFSTEAGDVYVFTDQPAPPVEEYRAPGFTAVHATFHSELEVNRVVFRGNNAMLIHAPGHVIIDRPASARMFSFAFGLRDEAYAGPDKTDGVTFLIEF